MTQSEDLRLRFTFPHGVRMAIAAACLILGTAPAVAQKFDDIAQTPPMGWNSWNHFGCNIDEKLIRATADAMVANGMRDAGYAYVNLDDCWQGARDAGGTIQPDATRFPAGMKALADYVHARGLKFGLYSDAGSKTCGGRPGSQGHEYQDARQYARWGVDYLKYDWCSTGEGAAKRNPQEAYATMRDAIHAAGRPMILSICEWGDSKPWSWAAPVGHLWRTTGDITNCWDCIVSHGAWFSSGVLAILDQQSQARAAAGPGHWNDPDMMEVGNLPTFTENRAHFTLWAMLAAPLIAGTDVDALKPEIRSILIDRDVIAVDQDKLGIQGFAWIKRDGFEVWAKPLEGGDWAIALLNRGSAPRSETVDWNKLDLKDDLSGHDAKLATTRYRIRDLWTKRTAADSATPLTVALGGHDVALYRLSPTR